MNACSGKVSGNSWKRTPWLKTFDKGLDHFHADKVQYTSDNHNNQQPHKKFAKDSVGFGPTRKNPRRQDLALNHPWTFQTSCVLLHPSDALLVSTIPENERWIPRSARTGKLALQINDFYHMNWYFSHIFCIIPIYVPPPIRLVAWH